jgi:hypothetical protein
MASRISVPIEPYSMIQVVDISSHTSTKNLALIRYQDYHKYFSESRW